MLRDKNLVPLSRQHQHALALCVRIVRASPVPDGDLASWQAEIQRIFEHEIKFHFVAEEAAVFPAALAFSELKPLVEELLAEHATLRADFAKAERREMLAADLLAFVRRLSAHIRKEERQLFEGMQERMNGEQAARLGLRLEQALQDAAQACALPKLKSK